MTVVGARHSCVPGKEEEEEEKEEVVEDVVEKEEEEDEGASEGDSGFLVRNCCRSHAHVSAAATTVAISVCLCAPDFICVCSFIVRSCWLVGWLVGWLDGWLVGCAYPSKWRMRQSGRELSFPQGQDNHLALPGLAWPGLALVLPAVHVIGVELDSKVSRENSRFEGGCNVVFGLTHDITLAWLEDYSHWLDCTPVECRRRGKVDVVRGLAQRGEKGCRPERERAGTPTTMFEVGGAG
ncbi:hypothetical protein M0804_005961 [Polistes exclamans]|nr:hypothetical protein M0804_005961 [Polistes exclamans]